jgi:hypothetical protein
MGASSWLDGPVSVLALDPFNPGTGLRPPRRKNMPMRASAILVAMHPQLRIEKGSRNLINRKF